MFAPGTRTARNLDEMRKYGFKVLISPRYLEGNGWKAQCWTDGTVAPYAIDNGAWTAYSQGIPFEEELFLRTLDAVGDGAEWICIPDIVAHPDSLAFSLSWMPRMLARYEHVLLPVQNGMTPAQIAPLIGPRVGIAVGGDDDWKLGTIYLWAQLARKHNAHCHVLRVNSQKRIRHCMIWGAQTADGLSAAKFALSTPKLDKAVQWKQQGLFI